MFSERAFFSFVDLAEASLHREYNEWHQFDHRPENLLLPGVAWGDRWARPAEYTPLGESCPDLSGTDYVAMYWFRPPYEQSIAEWRKLGEDSFQWGRGPLIPGVRRPFTAFFTPVKGYAAERVTVSADALPFRPNRGLHIMVSRLAEPHGPRTHEQYSWYDRVRLPAMVNCPGVAGAWTFALHSPRKHPAPPLDGMAEYPPNSVRIRLLYLDADPAEVTHELADREKEWDASGFGPPCPDAETILLTGPLRTIDPWESL
ncbi:hypothetical protein [Nocardia sp. CA-120079]|uniref:hypothetical protein n=1 Tax=Nocardia sp. CA-120079 TaxID=3239974 RepID=UPI003D9872C7